MHHRLPSHLLAAGLHGTLHGAQRAPARRAVLGLLLAGGLCSPAWSQADTGAPAAAQLAAAQWLAETDAGSHGAAWTLAGAAFRRAVAREQWEAAAQQVLGPLGAVRGREVNGSKATRSLPGAPDGEYLILSFRTEFANKAGAIETLTLVREADGQWRTVGYFIR
jgi:hypothetical protein